MPFFTMYTLGPRKSTFKWLGASMTISLPYDFTLIGLDCMLRPDMCGPNASCKETNKKVANQWKYHQCVCNPGFVGNGITCIDATDLANGDSFSFF